MTATPASVPAWVPRHLDLLGTLAILWGAMAMLVGVAMLLLALGAVAQIYEPSGAAVGFAAGVTAAFFVVIGVFALLWGGAHVWAAVLLRRRQGLGRVLLLALAMTNLLVFPFGTALGVYALWILLGNDTRHLFELPPPPQPSAG